MNAADLLIAIFTLPMLTAAAVAFSRKHANLRETMTLLGGVGVAVLTAYLYDLFIHSDRAITLHLFTIIPGLDLAFKIEPLSVISRSDNNRSLAL